MTLISGSEATAGQGVYRIMAAQLERRSTDVLGLRITLRLINADRFRANFWGESARLIVDGAPIAPTEAPDVVVPAQSSMQEVFLFEVPDNTSTAEPEVGQVGQETARIPVELKPAQL